jgi:hypothetical protein
LQDAHGLSAEFTSKSTTKGRVMKMRLFDDRDSPASDGLIASDASTTCVALVTPSRKAAVNGARIVQRSAVE